MNDRWACEAPNHAGDRSQVHRLDRFTRRQTFMRADGAQRLHELSMDRICKVCIEAEMEGRGRDQNQGSFL